MHLSPSVLEIVEGLIFSTYRIIRKRTNTKIKRKTKKELKKAITNFCILLGYFDHENNFISWRDYLCGNRKSKFHKHSLLNPSISTIFYLALKDVIDYIM